MIHTFDLRYVLYDREDIEALFSSFSFSAAQQKKTDKQAVSIENNKRTLLPYSELAYKALGNSYPGMKFIAVRKIYLDNGFYITLSMEPQLLITGIRSIDLFRASSGSIKLLQESFNKTLHSILNDSLETIQHLENWNCQRIDYSMNLSFPNQQDVDTFENITKKTQKHTYTESIRDMDIYLQEQSTACGNNSLKAIIYDKRKQIESEYAGMPEAELEAMCESAAGIVRYEVQCYRHKVYRIKADNHFPSRSIMYYLNEDISDKITLQKYKEIIGLGDFYTLRRAKKIIDDSFLASASKKRLYDFLRLMAQSKSISRGKECFITGTPLRNVKPVTIVKGTKGTYYTRMRMLKSLNINPMPIPRDNSSTSFLHNPIGIEA